MLGITKNSRIQRLPLYIEAWVWSAETCKLLIAKSNDGDLVQTQYALGLPFDIANFILKHCCCAICHRRFSPNFESCPCGDPFGEERFLEAEFKTSLHGELQKLLLRERGRVNGAARARRLKENGGAFDRKHIPAMHAAQEGRCFYCLAQIHLDGPDSLHADHYVPIADGGRNDVSNIVLACRRCNHLKNAKSADVFDRMIRMFRPAGSTVDLKRIRRSLKSLKEELAVSAVLLGGTGRVAKVVLDLNLPYSK